RRRRNQFRPRGDRNHRPGQPRPGGPDFLRRRRSGRQLPARRRGDRGRRPPCDGPADPERGSPAPGRFRRQDPAVQDRPGRRRR
ncbi:hypothetical protein LTR94_036729, partial [Friedmanniomyces endolithicus]